MSENDFTASNSAGFRSGGFNGAADRSRQSEAEAGVSAAYQTLLSDQLEAVLRIDVAYKSEVYVDAENTPLLRQRNHAILNASAEPRFDDIGLSVRVGIDNIAERRIIPAGYEASTRFGFAVACCSPPQRYNIIWAGVDHVICRSVGVSHER